MYETYLKKAGVVEGKPMAADTQHAKEVVQNNPELSVSDFNLLGDPTYPFPIIGFTLLTPLTVSPQAGFDRPWLLVESSPIATGVSHNMEVEYKARNGTTYTMQTGGYIESAFFGSSYSGEWESGVSVTAERLFSAERASGASSAAPEGFFALTTSRLADVLGYHQNYFAPGSSAETTEILVGDGGSVEDVTLIPFLKRGVDSIVLFCNFEVPLASAETYDPFTRFPRDSDVELLPSLLVCPAFLNRSKIYLVGLEQTSAEIRFLDPSITPS